MPEITPHHRRAHGWPCVLASVLALATAAPLPAQEPGAGIAIQGLMEGFWIFPTEPDLSPEAVSALCRRGMTLADGQGVALSLLPLGEGDGMRLIADSDLRCDEGPKAAICALTLADLDNQPPGAAQVLQVMLEFDVDPQGHYFMRYRELVGGSSDLLQYPQRCDMADLQALLRAGLWPQE